MGAVNNKLNFPPIDKEIIHKMLLIKYIEPEFIDELVSLIKKKLFDCLYDKIILMDPQKIFKLVFNYPNLLYCDKLHFSIRSVCDPNNACNECNHINKLMENNYSSHVDLFGYHYFSSNMSQSMSSRRNVSPITCDEIPLMFQLFLYDPCRILLVSNKLLEIATARVDVLYIKLNSLLTQKKYITLLELNSLIIGSNPKTIMDDYYCGIQIESTNSERTRRFTSSICVRCEK